MQLIAAVHKQRPELRDIKEVFRADQDRIGDGSFVYAFAHASGMALVFRRGGGDCPAGCTENEYWYFTTDAACIPSQVGHYRPTFAGNCVQQDGVPMWGVPPAPDPLLVCGADNRPQNVSGTYAFSATGKRAPCAEKGGDPLMPVTVAVTMNVVQAQDDASKGTVTVNGTGVASIDGQPLSATFVRRRLVATRMVSNLPAVCVDQHETTVKYDFETDAAGTLHFTELRAVGCPPSQAYCKGALLLDLTLTK